MLDWVVVGGGIHGTHHAISLIDSGVVKRDRIRILDPHTNLLASWTRNTARTGMRYLRSPRVHHLELDPHGLDEYLEDRKESDATRGLYRCPRLDLFQDHCSQLIDGHRLDRIHTPCRVTGLSKKRSGYTVTTDSGSLNAKRVLLAMGTSEQPNWPSWARRLREEGASVFHIFDEACPLDILHAPIVVLGGGLTAVQTALRLAKSHPGKVTVLSRHPVRVSEFDSDPCWLGPKCLKNYEKISCPQKQRAVIQTARQTGSIPAQVLGELCGQLESGAIQWIEGEAADAKWNETKITIQDRDGHPLASSNSLVLATGFAPTRPGGAWLDTAIDIINLPLAPCGYPQLAAGVEWTKNLFVTGPLAELRIGPAARNIKGARMAAELIAEHTKLN